MCNAHCTCEYYAGQFINLRPSSTLLWVSQPFCILKIVQICTCPELLIAWIGRIMQRLSVFLTLMGVLHGYFPAG